jgi:selenophosphate synthetase-related protein
MKLRLPILGKGANMFYCPLCGSYWASEEEVNACDCFDILTLYAGPIDEEAICEDCEAETGDFALFI